MRLFAVPQVYLLSKEEGGREKPYTNAYQAQLFCKTWDAPAQMTLPSDKDMIMPGEDASIEFIIMKNMVWICAFGCSYTLRDRLISSQTHNKRVVSVVLQPTPSFSNVNQHLQVFCSVLFLKSLHNGDMVWHI